MTQGPRLTPEERALKQLLHSEQRKGRARFIEWVSSIVDAKEDHHLGCADKPVQDANGNNITDTDGRFVYEPDPEHFCDACALIIKVSEAILEGKLFLVPVGSDVRVFHKRQLESALRS